MTRRYVLAIAAVPLLLSFLSVYNEPNITWWTTHGLQKVRPYDPEPEAVFHQVKIFAARNEFEPFQIVFRSEDRNADAFNIDIDVTDLQGPGDAIIAKSNISVYLERYLDLKVPSSIEGGTGEWPDPLVPRVDRYTRERRSAFPFKVSKGRNQPVWLDVYVPWSTPPGSFRGKVLVLVSGKPWLSIPLDLEVWNFDLPSTSSLITTFAFSGVLAVKEHYSRYTNEKDVADLTTLYQKAALWHRITLDGSSGLPPSVTVVRDQVSVNWDAYDKQIAPFLDGYAFGRNDPLRDAKFTSVVLHTPPLLKTKRHQIQFWRQAAAHFRKKGWFDRLFNYLWDEPARSQFAKMLDLGETVHAADPALKNLVTAPFHQDWSGVVDIWTPVINCFERKNGQDYCEMTVSRSGYDAELSKGKQLWWYQACSTHGCNIVGGDYFTGWPGYMIDDAPIRHRIMEWMTWKYRIGGELYFNTIEAYSGKRDPWTDVHLFGGNGDGTLFYPGSPNIIGGNSNIPIESIRLKLIREGLEDYEYLTQLAKLKGSTAVADTLNNFIRNVHDFDHDPKALYTIREEIGRQLDGRTK